MISNDVWYCRKWIATEMDNILTNRAKYNEPIVVHTINSVNPLEIILIRNAIAMAEQFPTVLFNVSNERLVSARASLPMKYSSERFNAEIWLKETFDAAEVKVARGMHKIKSDCSVCGLKDVSESGVFDATKIAHIQSAAKLIFEKYVSS